MAHNSLSNFSLEGSYGVVIQQGFLEQSTAGACTISCKAIRATDLVQYYPVAQTAPAAALPGTGVYTIVITAGTGFVATPADATMRGEYQYVIVRTNAPFVSTTSV